MAGNPVNGTDPTGLFCIGGKNPNGSCRGSGAVKKAGELAEDAVGLAGTAVKISPVGQALDAGSRLTNHSLGMCAGGNLFGGYDLMGSICYKSTPSGQSGFTASAGGGGGAPFGVAGLLGPSVSSAQNGSDLSGTSGYGWLSVGELHAGGGGSFSVSENDCGDTIWQATVGWAPGGRMPAPFSFGGGASQT